MGCTASKSERAWESSLSDSKASAPHHHPGCLPFSSWRSETLGPSCELCWAEGAHESIALGRGRACVSWDNCQREGWKLLSNKLLLWVSFNSQNFPVFPLSCGKLRLKTCLWSGRVTEGLSVTSVSNQLIATQISKIQGYELLLNRKSFQIFRP